MKNKFDILDELESFVNVNRRDLLNNKSYELQKSTYEPLQGLKDKVNGNTLQNNLSRSYANDQSFVKS